MLCPHPPLSDTPSRSLATPLAARHSHLQPHMQSPAQGARGSTRPARWTQGTRRTRSHLHSRTGRCTPTGRPVTKGHVVAQGVDTPTVTLLSPHIWGPLTPRCPECPSKDYSSPHNPPQSWPPRHTGPQPGARGPATLSGPYGRRRGLGAGPGSSVPAAFPGKSCISSC